MAMLAQKESGSIRLFLAVMVSGLAFVCFFPRDVVAAPGKLQWSVVETPHSDNSTNVLCSPSEVNRFVIGYDGLTMYAVDSSWRDSDSDGGVDREEVGRLYKSSNGGVTWQIDADTALYRAGAKYPVWNVAVAPDDVDFVVAVVDASGTPSGPQRIFISMDGGQSWQENTPSGLTGYVGSVAISPMYGKYRDVAIGTRSGAGGEVYVITAGVVSPRWKAQNLEVSALPADVLALEFSPSYIKDEMLVVVAATSSSTYLCFGKRDRVANTTFWGGICAKVDDINWDEVITADLELPSDFDADRGDYRICFVSIDGHNGSEYVGGVYSFKNKAFQSSRNVPGGRVASIAYYGTGASGTLLAGVVGASKDGKVTVWRTNNPASDKWLPSRWVKSSPEKSPTGGVGTGRANAQVAWSPGGLLAYCGTSSANLEVGGTGWDVGRWPRGLLEKAAGDESAFSVSPYSLPYQLILEMTGRTRDRDVGNIWNQLSLIDTSVARLCDVAALEATEEAAEKGNDYNILYLVSVTENNTCSLWRSITHPLGQYWERVFTYGAGSKDVLVRVRQTTFEESTRSRVVTVSEMGSGTIYYSTDEGQSWQYPLIAGGIALQDFALAKDDIIYILDKAAVYKYALSGSLWIKMAEADTGFSYGHTIAVPLKNPPKQVDEGDADWVVVGEKGPPDGLSRMVYADFSRIPVVFLPPEELRKSTPIQGDVHVVCDDRFENNLTVYAGVCDSVSGQWGKIYRWILGQSEVWEDLGPPNSAFYGVVMRNGVLYGVWEKPESAEIVTDAGVDRTLYARAPVPPPPEWDDLTEGLPEGEGAVDFTREPSALKISSNKYNTLWAIDNKEYDWEAKKGCLWMYIDTAAKFGPWVLAPAYGDVLACDPVSGLSGQVDFRWRALEYANVYEIQIAKDKEFTVRVLVSENITPADQTSPAAYYPAGGLIAVLASEVALPGTLECGHGYYWRVRARQGITGEVIRSPWSATMYFITKVGVPVHSRYLGPVLLSPASGADNVVPAPAFSWAPLPEVVKYEFVLAKDPELKQVLVRKRVAGTSFRYEGELGQGVTYFWQVKGVEPFVTEPSAIAVFTVAKAKAEPMPKPGEPVVILTWAGIAVYTILAAVVMVLIRARLGQRRDKQGAQEE